LGVVYVHEPALHASMYAILVPHGMDAKMPNVKLTVPVLRK
jgi:hypothetical protein